MTFGAAGILDRFRSVEPQGGGYGAYERVHIPGLFYRTFGKAGGHARLFGGPKKLGGFMIYSYNHGPVGWSSRYVYMLVPGLVAMIHEDDARGTLKTCSPKVGWFFRFAKLKIAKVYGGFSITFHQPDRFR